MSKANLRAKKVKENNLTQKQVRVVNIERLEIGIICFRN